MLGGEYDTDRGFSLFSERYGGHCIECIAHDHSYRVSGIVFCNRSYCTLLVSMLLSMLSNRSKVLLQRLKETPPETETNHLGNIRSQKLHQKTKRAGELI